MDNPTRTPTVGDRGPLTNSQLHTIFPTVGADDLWNNHHILIVISLYVRTIGAPSYVTWRNNSLGLGADYSKVLLVPYKQQLLYQAIYALGIIHILGAFTLHAQDGTVYSRSHSLSLEHLHIGGGGE